MDERIVRGMATPAIRRPAVLAPLQVRAIRDGLTIAGALALLALIPLGHGGDIHAYWAVSAVDPYGLRPADTDAFLYSPVAALAALPLHLLPFEVVRIAWLAVNVACLAYLLGPLALASIALYPVWTELSYGNVHLLYGVLLVAAFRYPAAWAFMLLTKVTPGVGIMWFAVRREWRSLSIALGFTTLLAAASFLVVPSWWPEWVATLLNASRAPLPPFHELPAGPLWLRLPIAAFVVIWSARTNRQWPVAVAVVLAMPVLWWNALAVLAAIPRLARR